QLSEPGGRRTGDYQNVFDKEREQRLATGRGGSAGVAIHGGSERGWLRPQSRPEYDGEGAVCADAARYVPTDPAGEQQRSISSTDVDRGQRHRRVRRPLGGRRTRKRKSRGRPSQAG